MEGLAMMGAALMSTGRFGEVFIVIFLNAVPNIDIGAQL